ncbi:hypothetical protein KDW_04910 [Dictyobacter vulcani]|uniref:Uncharacterized protein n=1 Tax=Dictyobacter vulcani TaxID=2607529 RepID=A0A5J4KJD6_9CHLR|nr:hypothetical protein KDW_04910 [Dictyobacter vulcani]
MIVYHILKKKMPYQDLGPTYLDRLDEERAKRQAIRRLDVLGYEVALTPKEVSA